MSTVLWANLLIDGVVSSDESDKVALHRHLDKLDGIFQRVAGVSLQSFCDTTDLEFNLGDDDLPEGMTSTNQIMAVSGKWIPAADAARAITAVLSEIEGRKTRFGLLRNDHDAIVAELKEGLACAGGASATEARFNFCIVM
jgi:hypothetical protein